MFVYLSLNVYLFDYHCLLSSFLYLFDQKSLITFALKSEWNLWSQNSGIITISIVQIYLHIFQRFIIIVFFLSLFIWFFGANSLNFISICTNIPLNFTIILSVYPIILSLFLELYFLFYLFFFLSFTAQYFYTFLSPPLSPLINHGSQWSKLINTKN